MQKGERQQALLGIIRETPSLNQVDLAKRLVGQGFRVTQASVSRDLDELGIEKRNGRYVEPKVADPANNFGRVEFETAGDCLIVGR